MNINNKDSIRDLIYDAVLSEESLDDMTMKGISEKVFISRQGMYRYFPNIEELLNYCLIKEKSKVLDLLDFKLGSGKNISKAIYCFRKSPFLTKLAISKKYRYIFVDDLENLIKTYLLEARIDEKSFEGVRYEYHLRALSRIFLEYAINTQKDPNSLEKYIKEIMKY